MELSTSFSLQIVSWVLKANAAIAVLTGFVVDVLVVYAWGRITATYDALRAWLETLPTGDLLGGAVLDPLPLWPPLLTAIVILYFAIILGTISLGAGLLIDLRLEMVAEERQQREWEVKLWREVHKHLNP